jgi:hypothetical protein
MSGRTSKYRDDFSKTAAIRILRVFRGLIKNYRFYDSDPNLLVFRLHVNLIKHDSLEKGNPLPSFLSLLEKYNGKCRMYGDQMMICIEVTIPRRKQL